MSKKPARSRRATEVKEAPDMETTFENNWFTNYNIRQPFYLNDKHKVLYNLLQSPTTNMVFVDGPAGSMKTYISVYAALELIKANKYEKLVYIRSVAESASKSLGSLPGTSDEKFQPYLMPLIEKVHEICGRGSAHTLIHNNIIEAIPVNFCRGLTFTSSIVIIDEAQNMTKSELVTILTRFGRNSIYVVVGDVNQSDINQSGFKDIAKCFDNTDSIIEGIHNVKFENSEIMRSKILRFICSQLGH